jgi:hypothetical protein
VLHHSHFLEASSYTPTSKLFQALAFIFGVPPRCV